MQRKKRNNIPQLMNFWSYVTEHLDLSVGNNNYSFSDGAQAVLECNFVGVEFSDFNIFRFQKGKMMPGKGVLDFNEAVSNIITPKDIRADLVVGLTKEGKDMLLRIIRVLSKLKKYVSIELCCHDETIKTSGNGRDESKDDQDEVKHYESVYVGFFVKTKRRGFICLTPGRSECAKVIVPNRRPSYWVDMHLDDVEDTKSDKKININAKHQMNID